ncbi:cytochrome P450 [Rhizopogon salebrosus TDB-379]|nr:cytochrome P450 [Rhizopogon salebrosus TDB-379]
MSAGIVVIFVAAFTVYCYSRRRSKLPLPPGPPSKFLTGNTHQLPKQEPWRTYNTWAETYGPVFSFRVPNRQFILLNTLKAATELLDQRASTYSDRPRIWMLELAQRYLNPFSIYFNHPHFKVYRTMFKASLSPRTIRDYRLLQTEESRVLLDGLHKTPQHFVAHIRRNTAAVVLNLAYGWKVTQNDDYFIRALQQGMVIFTMLVQPGRWLVEAIPSLRFVPSWFPGAKFKRVALDLGQKSHGIDAVPLNWVKQQIQSGSYMPSFASSQLLPEDGSTVDTKQEEIIKWCCMGIFVGGVDTTGSSIISFVLAMMLYPDVQKRSQLELDDVVGQDRFPIFEDRDKLPYIVAIIQEVTRWAPVAPQGLPHRAMKEDVYEGYRIPEGAIVIANIFSIARDGGIYPDPLEFRPERFLGPSPQVDPHRFVFGFGRRACPGMYFAEASLYLNIACILAAFTISKPLDEKGEEITPPAEFEGGEISRPKPFECRFIPRNKDLLATLS